MNRVAPYVIFISCLLLFSCKQKQPPPSPPAPVNLLTVKAQTVEYYDRYPATTQALSQVVLLAQVQGYITGIYFKEGSHVSKGQKLYEIDQHLYEQSYNAAAANLRVAQGNLKQAQEDADRYSYLNKNKAVATQLYDHAMVALQNAKNSVQAAAESVKSAKTNLNYAIIKAPFDGTIGFSQVKLGNLATVGQTVLNTISTENPMAADILINEKQLPYFEDLQGSKYKNVDSLFTLLLPNNALYPGTGQISVIDRAVDPQTGSIRVRIVFPNPTSYLRAGMSCVVKVHNLDSNPQILIPNKAVVEQMGEYFVYIAKDTTMSTSADTSAKKQAATQKAGLYALQRKVQVGETVGPNVIIKGGISEGEKIVVDGVQSIHDGSPITTANKVPPAASGKGAGGK